MCSLGKVAVFSSALIINVIQVEPGSLDVRSWNPGCHLGEFM